MPTLSDARVLRLLEELKAAYVGFEWESGVWAKEGHRRSPYRTLVLFGLSARTRDSLLVEMCQRFFQCFPDAETLAEDGGKLLGEAQSVVRPGQTPIVASMAEMLRKGVPRQREGLLEIKGVGGKIAECVLAYGWGEEALPLDANCVRVLDRVFGLGTGRNSPASLREELKCLYRRNRRRLAKRRTAMVDVHEMLRLHGQVCCKRTPECRRCPVSGCQFRREPWDESSVVEVSPAMWDDWRELIHEPAAV